MEWKGDIERFTKCASVAISLAYNIIILLASTWNVRLFFCVICVYLWIVT